MAQTNRDVWEVTDDARYNATVQSMNNLGQIGVEHDGTQMIEKVLWSQGVLQFETIFTSTQTAFSAQRLNIYDPPNKSGALGPSTPPMTYIKQ